MYILQIEDFFHPDAGYQINIISKYMVQAGHKVTIVTGTLDNVYTPTVAFFGKDNIDEKDKRYEERYGVKIIRVPVKKIISGRAQFSHRIFDVINREKPDIVYVHGNDSLFGMQYLHRYKKLGYPLIMDSHMLAMASKNKLSGYFHKFYKTFFTTIIKKNRIKVIRTQDDPYVRDALGIPLKLAPWISVGSDTMLFHPDRENRDKFRMKNNIGKDSFVVLYAGKLDESKGGLLLAEGILKKIATDKDVVFCIVGKTVGKYGKAVEDAFKRNENTIIRFPTQKYENLAEFYQAADMAVFPRQCSLSFYDVQATGLPVLFEDDSVNESRISGGNAITFASDSKDDFRNKLIYMINMDSERFESMKKASVNYVLNGFDYKEITDHYLELIEKEMKRQRKKLR